MPTMSDIALECGISRSVVSLVLNGRDRELGIAAGTRDQILRVAREMGYCRNELAASVAKKRSRVLAFVTAEMGSIEYTGRIQNGVLDAASARNYTVIALRLKGASQSDVTRKILGWKAAGAVFHVSLLEEAAPITAVLDRNGIPWGTVNLSNPGGIGVTTNDASGIEQIVKLLRNNGHRRIAFLTIGESREEFRVRREAGFARGIEMYCPAGNGGILRLEDDSAPGNTAAMAAFAENIRRNGIDAVICESDHLAAALARGALAAGLAIPDAFSITGFGNSLIAEASFPRITTVAQDFEEMGMRTVNRIADVIGNRKISREAENMLPVKIIERDSVANRNPA